MGSCRIPIPEDVSLWIQMLHYELLGYINLIRSIVLDTESRYNTENYERLMKEYQEKNAEYHMALDEVKATFLPEQYRNNQYTMTILFEESAILVERQVCHK